MGPMTCMRQAMRTHPTDPRLQEIGLATVAAMALRSPDNAVRLVGMGAALVSLQAMRTHKTVGSLQRQVRGLRCDRARSMCGC